MKIFKRSVLGLLLTLGAAGTIQATDYGLPSGIQEGNILHCFNWTASEVKASLADIAASGFGAVQISPCQRPDVRVGTSWHDLYRPYDLAFKSSSYCSEEDLRSLCSEAANYGIKIIVDVVANHVDKTAGYHDTWWDGGGRVRWEGGIDYGNRNSITHGQLGDYGDIVSENADVIARGKAYVEKLKSLGVKGIRWDAAKHIGLPSEGCGFWSSVTSVPGMYHYGEILDAPGPNASIIKEYAGMMSVTDNRYSNGAAKDNGGIPRGYGGDWVVNQRLSDTKVVYWAESHDTYANDEWSQNVDQSVIDRAYASMACRNGATCLYLARPNAKGFNNIKVGKGSTAYNSKHVAEVNKFRNAMTGRKDWFESNGNACSITRENGGAVIVMKGSGNVSVTNGGGYCPAGTYTDRVSGGTFTVTASTISGNVGSSGIAVIYNDGENPPTPPTPPTPPVPGDVTIYYDNSATNWSNVNIHYWSSPSTNWPGTSMTKVEGNIWKYTFTTDPSGLKGFLFCDGSGSGDNNQTADVNGAPADKHLYKGAGGAKGAVTDQGEYQGGDDPAVPTVTANPASGATFTESITVTLTVSPAATIYYTTDGATPTTSSSVYSSPLKFTKTVTLKTLAVTSEGGKKEQSFTYTLNDGPTPPTPPTPGNNLITDYYKVNPNGKVGTQKTMHMNGHPAVNAMSNWTDDELIAQGVARDVCQAFRGTHERPIVDSYALYAAYDNDNLYLGVQFVYTVWDAGGEGKQPGESKPYNMDGHMILAFDLDPNLSFDGYIGGTGPIWSDQFKGAKFNNGVDHIIMLSTKPQTNNFTLFKPTPDGHASYDPDYCIVKPSGLEYGYSDGLLPSIEHVWGQSEFGYDPELLKGNTGFVDLRSEIDDSAHTFYEFKIPLSVLGCTADYIRLKGIGVMYVDKYGVSPVGGTPYDPSYFDDPFSEYSYGDNTSAEKEDEDIITYKPARIGFIGNSGVESLPVEDAVVAQPEYYNLQGVRVTNPEQGIYIVRRGNKVTKEVIR